jgi:hypothetical protein
MLEGQDPVDASTGYASTARIACEVSLAVMPSAAGTRRSDLAEGYTSLPRAVGIPVLFRAVRMSIN